MGAGSWWSQPLTPARSVHALAIGERTALFCARTQALSELNHSAALAWHALAARGSCAAIVASLQQHGASVAESEAFAASIVREWLKLGYVVPTDTLQQRPAFSMNVGLAPLSATLRFFGTAGYVAARDVFGHLQRHCGPHELQIDVAGLDDEDFVFVDGISEGLMPRVQTVPRLKGLLTKHYCAAVDEGFLAHAALVSSGEKRVLMTGAPGAGKTTLTLALCAADFAYGGDDIVHITADGRAEGASFAAAVKSGAWALLAPLYPELDELPTHLRFDGQSVRYLTPRLFDRGGPKPIDALLVLERAESAGASLARITPREALCVLLASGYAERGGVEGAMLEGLAADLSRAVCARLTYSTIEGAVGLLQRLFNE